MDHSMVRQACMGYNIEGRHEFSWQGMINGEHIEVSLDVFGMQGFTRKSNCRSASISLTGKIRQKGEET